MNQAVPALTLALLTEGDPGQRTGGHLYQQRMAAAAPMHHARVDFVSIRPASFAQQITQARRLLATLPRYDALLIDSLVAGATAWWLPPVVRRLPIIAVVHQQPGGADHRGPRSALQRRLDLLAYRRVTAMVAVSDWLAGRLRGHGVPAHRIAVVPPGLDLEAHPAPAADLRSRRHAALLCVSNWTRNKGIHLLLQALASLPPQSATLHLAGYPESDARYGRRLRTRISGEDLRDRVVIHGSLPPAEVARLMHSADILVHPSRHEAYGAVVAEAMAAGLPVIAFKIDNLPYLVRDGSDGMLAPFPDVGWLSSAVRLLVQNPGRRAGMASSARARAQAWPTWGQSADRFFAAVRKAVDAGQAESLM